MIQSLSGGVCVAQLHAPPLNTLSYALLDEILAVVRQANATPEIRGVVLTGGPEHFSAGVDIGIFERIATDADAVQVCQVFQQAFQEIEDCSKPIAVALAGRVMGGALELALACHVRVAARGTRFSMPEVTLGFNPGAGGTQRLPRLVGVGPALRMLLSGETIAADQAQHMGLLDAVCEPAALVETARAALADVESPRRTGQLIEKLADPAAQSALDEACARVARGRPEIPGPAAIVEAVRVGVDHPLKPEAPAKDPESDGRAKASLAAGLRAEQEQFARCLRTPATRNKIYLFFATRQTAKVPELTGIEPKKLSRAAVVGMGAMGTGIAQALIQSGFSVVAFDQDLPAVARATARIHDSIAKRVSAGKLAPERAEATLSRLSAASSYADLAGADVVFEAVFEDAAVKRAVFRSIEQACPAETILASNTSSIRLDDLAEGMQRPERLIGMHFFNPAPRMPLVEIIPREATPRPITAAALQLAKTLGKTVVVVKDCEGFLVDRLFVPYLKEAFWLLQEGADPATVDRAMVEFGFPMGPLTLIDMAGLDILECSDRAIARAYPRHGVLSPVAVRLVASGQLGQKTGAGVYRYEAGDRSPRPNPAAQQIVAEVQREQGLVPRLIGEDEITDRLVLRLVNEAWYALEEGVARSASDLDVATVLGIGFPDFRGGVARYAVEAGRERVVRRLESLTARCGERFLPSAWVRNSQWGG